VNLFRAIHLLDEQLAGFIGGVRLTRKHDLNRAMRVGDERYQAVELAEDKVGAFVSGETPRKTNG